MSLSTREQELAYVRDFKKKIGESDEDSTNYGVFGIPTYVLIDRRGNVRLMGMGAKGSGDTTLDKAIRKLIEEPAANARATTN